MLIEFACHMCSHACADHDSGLKQHARRAWKIQTVPLGHGTVFASSVQYMAEKCPQIWKVELSATVFLSGWSLMMLVNGSDGQVFATIPQKQNVS